MYFPGKWWRPLRINPATDDYVLPTHGSARFSAQVIALNLSAYSYSHGEARTGQVWWPREIYSARQKELEAIGDKKRPLVYLDTGIAVSKRGVLRERKANRERLEARQAFVPPKGHPGYDMLAFLNGQEQRVLGMVFSRNLDDLIGTAIALPQGMPEEEASRTHNIVTISRLMDEYNLTYKAVTRTKRIYAEETNLHQLSRELRKIALAGCTSLDLQNAQLALAARYWNIPALQEHLQALARNGKSFWSLLLGACGLGVGAKPVVKTAVYALIFGQSRRNLVRQFLAGVGLERREAQRVKSRFFGHPIIRELLLARNAKMAELLRDGGLYDAYREWIGAADRRAARSAMAQQLQSHEFKLMSAVLPVLKRERTITVCSWLHDGMTVHFGDRHEASRQTARLVRVVNEEARQLKIITRLEVEHL